MRLFAALTLAPVAVERLARLRLRMSSPADGLRWSAPEQWHITLQYFGDISSEMAEALQAELQRQLSRVEPADVEIDALETFPAKGILFARVLDSAALSHLNRLVLQSAVACGVRCESRPFRPHVTLARSKGKKGNKVLKTAIAAGLPALGQGLRWIAKEVQLLESTLGPQGASFRTCGSISLGASGWQEGQIITEASPASCDRKSVWLPEGSR